MRSKAHIAGHPIHPMLIPFPVAFFVGSLVADIISRATGSESWFFVGYVLTLGGWIMALVAAIPGLLDYFKVIPSGTEAKRTATTHMILNVSIAGLYFISWLVKNVTGAPTRWASLILEIIGCGLLGYSGWLGWTLVYRHRMGIDEERAEEKRGRHVA